MSCIFNSLPWFTRRKTPWTTIKLLQSKRLITSIIYINVDHLTFFFKQIKLGSREEARDGINRTALREIKLLQELKHPNIVGLLDVFGHRSNVSLVFEFVDTDLEQIIKDNNIVLTPGHMKAYMLMTLKGLEYLHLQWILHRV